MDQVVILAGGKGTRIAEVSGGNPKPLIKVHKISLIERQIDFFSRNGINSFLILLNFQSEKIINCLKQDKYSNLDIKFIVESSFLGTAGAVLNAYDFLHDKFIVSYADTIFDINLQRFCEFFEEEQNLSAAIFIHPNDHPHDSDLVSINDNSFIVNFHPKNRNKDFYYKNLVNAALYIIKKDSLINYSGVQKSLHKNFDFGRDLFPIMLSDGHYLKGYVSPEYIKDCGTSDRLYKIEKDITSGRVELSSLKFKQKGIFCDRDGTINILAGHINSAKDLIIYENVANSIKKLNDSNYKFFIVTNQPVIARGECSYSELENIHNKIETLIGEEGAYIDKIKFCPHHPDSGYVGEVTNLKISCACRKPNVQMIFDLEHEFNVDINESWMIGDSTTDLKTAENSFLTSILVETGESGRDGKYNITPNFIMPNFTEAVNFILNIYPAVISFMEDAIDISIKKNRIIFVGGNSKSGKSTFANIIKHNLKSKGRKVHIISTDRWLNGTGSKVATVLERHDIDECLSFLSKVTCSTGHPITLNLPFYNKFSKTKISNIENIVINPNDIIIIEGVIALYCSEVLGIFNNFYLDIDEKIRKKLIIREYCNRGYNKDHIFKVYRERLYEEFPWVSSFQKSANVINISNISGGFN